MLRAIVLGFLILILYLFQTALFPFFELGGVVPNLLLVITVSFGLMRGRKEGLFVGFFCGLLIDIFSGFALGPYALLYMYLGYINGFFHRLYYVEDVLLPIIMVAVNDFFYSTVVYIVFYLMRNRLDYGKYFMEIIIPEMIYTMLATLVLYRILMKVNKALKVYEERGDL
ncbi:MAG: rod shape-determining protein MreD [Lachnospiraceae bacterium]|nr:rod shape-determining protein MreD [Lachnospiraceae bacterium]